MTIDLAFRLDQMQPGRLLLECRSDSGRGWTADTGLLDAGRRHQVTRIIDGGPNLIPPVVDGALGDGGEATRKRPVSSRH